MNLIERICPKCKKSYRDYPALSRVDNQTEICPDCGTIEALESWERFRSLKKAVAEERA